MPDFKNGKIYKLVCNLTGKTHIGSTTQILCKRLTGHVTAYKKGTTITSKAIIEGGDYSIILIEDYQCDRKDQLLQRERYYIESMTCVNKHLPITSVEEKKAYYEANYEANKEKSMNKAKIII